MAQPEIAKLQMLSLSHGALNFMLVFDRAEIKYFDGKKSIFCNQWCENFISWEITYLAIF